MCEDGRSEAQEGFVEDEGWIEGSVGEVDNSNTRYARRRRVEASEGVAQESAGGFGEETVFGVHIEYEL